MAQVLQDWLTLLSVPGLGPTAFAELLQRFETPGDVLQTPYSRLRQDSGIPDDVASAIAERQDPAWAERQIDTASRESIQILTFSDPEYPQLLNQIHAPPPILFVKGDVSLLCEPTVAVVGSRSFTTYGRDNARHFAGQLAARGVTVISGMAKGIDAEAHRGALAVDGHTAAVLGSGLDHPYPSQNLQLFEEICERGVVVSEFPLGTRPEPHNFPRRNRVLSGLSLGVLVVEAGDRSGALITARHALEQNREVFAVPGPIHSGRSFGTHQLIKQGAVLVEQIEDILSELNSSLPLTRLRPALTLSPVCEQGLSNEEIKVLDCLTANEPHHIDVISTEADFTVEKALGILLGLELSDFVEQLPGKRFVLKRTANLGPQTAR